MAILIDGDEYRALLAENAQLKERVVKLEAKIYFYKSVMNSVAAKGEPYIFLPANGAEDLKGAKLAIAECKYHFDCLEVEKVHTMMLPYVSYKTETITFENHKGVAEYLEGGAYEKTDYSR